VWFTLCSVHVIFDVLDFGFKAFMVDGFWIAADIDFDRFQLLLQGL